MNTLAKLMVTQDLQKHMPKEVKLESPTSFKMQNSHMIKNHGASGFDSYYNMMKKRRTFNAANITTPGSSGFVGGSDSPDLKRID